MFGKLKQQQKTQEKGVYVCVGGGGEGGFNFLSRLISSY